MGTALWIISLARPYPLTSRIRDTSTVSAHNMLSQVQTAYCFSSAPCARSLARSAAAARAAKEPRDDNNSRARPPRSRHSRPGRILSLRLYEISSPFFRAWLTRLRPCPCSIHEGGRARETAIPHHAALIARVCAYACHRDRYIHAAPFCRVDFPLRRITRPISLLQSLLNFILLLISHLRVYFVSSESIIYVPLRSP